VVKSTLFGRKFTDYTRAELDGIKKKHGLPDSIVPKPKVPEGVQWKWRPNGYKKMLFLGIVETLEGGLTGAVMSDSVPVENMIVMNSPI
jgi:hypothetical protein